jgi:hypothetical protein
MRPRIRAGNERGGKAGVRRLAMASSAPKRMAAAKKSAPKKTAAKKPTSAKKTTPAKKAAPPKKPANAGAAKATPVAKPAPAPPRLATPIPSAGQPGPAKAPAAALRPAAAPGARPATASAEERRKALTRKFFARLRSLEAIVGADLRKRGSLVLMQAVDQWYNEAINTSATDITITNAAKTVIAHL